MNSELRKIKNKKSGAGADETVKSSWEFFDSLKFMTGISECVKTVGTVLNALVITYFIIKIDLLLGNVVNHNYFKIKNKQWKN